MIEVNLVRKMVIYIEVIGFDIDIYFCVFYSLDMYYVYIYFMCLRFFSVFAFVVYSRYIDAGENI